MKEMSKKDFMDYTTAAQYMSLLEGAAQGIRMCLPFVTDKAKQKELEKKLLGIEEAEQGYTKFLYKLQHKYSHLAKPNLAQFIK